MLVPFLLSLVSAPDALRWNLAGYPESGRGRLVLAVSDSSLEGRAWTASGPDGTRLSGILPAGSAGGSGQTPWRSHHAIDLSAAQAAGRWTLAVDGIDPVSIELGTRPWPGLASLALHHLSTVRSGPDPIVAWRRPSHLGDSACPVWVPRGEAESGAWKVSPSGRKLRAKGGWYDAGDYLKFTLTTAGTTWSLLRAWETDPGMFAATRGSDLPDVLDEARHGLEYLLGLFPDDTTFVIQVGDGRDHDQGSRLPEEDRLDGKRPVLTGLSPAHMALTSAALSLGARTFAALEGEQGFADTCARLALRTMEAAAVAPRREFFYRDATNDFYRDPTWYDNLALGAAETFRTTGDSLWRTRALAWLDSAGTASWASWGDWELVAAARLAEGDSTARKRFEDGIRGFVDWSLGEGSPWGVPMLQGWAPFDGYVVVAAEAVGDGTRDDDGARLAWDIWDYLSGRNNWGVFFAIDTTRERSVRHLYSQIHPLSGQVGVGALAEGPGSAAEHAELSVWFDIPVPAPEDTFNTATVVFYDDASDFQTMETTIGIQGGFLRMLAALDAAAARSAAGSARRSRASGAARLAVSDGWLRWDLEEAGQGLLRLVDASGRATTLRRGRLSAEGATRIPSGLGLRWAVLETEGGRLAIPVPPWAGRD